MRPTKISLAGFPGVRELGPEYILHLPCDALVPAALENAFTVDSAAAVRARIVVEAANAPDAEVVAHGAAIYGSRCQGCHGGPTGGRIPEEEAAI